MLKLSVKSIATFAMALGLAGLNLKGDEAIAQKNNLPLVVATNSVTCGLTQEIAANTIDLKCLIEPGADPHLYQPKPEDSKAIEQAELILSGGYNFESGLIKLIKATSNPAPKVAVHEIGVPKPQQLEEDGQTVTDPHVWHNAQNGIRIANAIADSLSKAFPNHATKYTSNTKQLTGELKQIDTWIKSQIQTIPLGQRKLVTTHDAMGYYANAYGIPIEGALQGISTEERPTAARVAELVKDIRKSGVPTIFAEKTVNPQLIEAVAREANVKVAERELYADGLGEPGTDGDTYSKMLVANTRTIVEGLGGSYAAFEAKPVPYRFIK
ncbi:zinc ABC transporter substrate-binding protein [Chroococcidiopsis sp. FACHB-1243]|uniref:metal ABC transporter solute-binding protein, Zn/Mn family n=1 Tax=Chroococcidiopsis sp. [FACHB-1243] TaxID=2692781 RepID=UPI0017801D3E|nr:zinc ABC transporter substrate-binding protein [Chroococcidiopsis sp. [FACHB-1243]]MBD2306379.1 zinc ABC transporter substrate-binding protein [Chroococcidiopsis sp. [FACHB-1243]]